MAPVREARITICGPIGLISAVYCGRLGVGG
jgi:hypothetical protein